MPSSSDRVSMLPFRVSEVASGEGAQKVVLRDEGSLSLSPCDSARRQGTTSGSASQLAAAVVALRCHPEASASQRVEGPLFDFAVHPQGTASAVPQPRAHSGVLTPEVLLRSALSLVALVLLTCISVFAQTPDYKNIGRAPTDAEVKAWNIDASPDGKGLPTGSGTAKDGAKIFAEKCAPCHTPSAEGGKLGPALVGGTGTLKSLHPVQTVGSYWPFPTTLWDYIHRAMPRGQGGSLEPDEVYSLTAFLLYRNGIVKEDDVLDAKSLTKIQMPNRQNFVPENLNDIWEHNKRACHTGTCP